MLTRKREEPCESYDDCFCEQCIDCVKIARFEVPGAPQGKARPRVTKNGTFTPKKTKDYEQLVKNCYLSKNEYNGNFKDPIQVEIIAYFGVPKSTSKANVNKMLSHELLPTKKPDTDNIAKAILDSLNGIAFHDDSQVFNLTVTKLYSTFPRVEVKIIY